MGTREDIFEDDVVKMLFLGNPVSPFGGRMGDMNKDETEVT